MSNKNLLELRIKFENYKNVTRAVRNNVELFKYLCECFLLDGEYSVDKEHAGNIMLFYLGETIFHNFEYQKRLIDDIDFIIDNLN